MTRRVPPRTSGSYRKIAGTDFYSKKVGHRWWIHTRNAANVYNRIGIAQESEFGYIARVRPSSEMKHAPTLAIAAQWLAKQAAR